MNQYDIIVLYVMMKTCLVFRNLVLKTIVQILVKQLSITCQSFPPSCQEKELKEISPLFEYKSINDNIL